MGSVRKAVLPPYAIPCAVLGLLFLFWRSGYWQSPTWEDPNAIVFLSVGDYGTAGSKNQDEVAAQMAATGKQHGARFIISLGDSFHDIGVTSVDDPLFYKSFEDVYTQPSLQKQWLMALGDHDHRGSITAQLKFSKKSKKWHMPAQYYVSTFKGGRGSDACTLDVIVTDSVSLEAVVASEDPAERRFASEFNMTAVGKKVGKKQLKWLKKTLAGSQSDWKIVVGHRPVLTCAIRPRFPAEAGFPGLLQPILQEYHVDAYLFGHDHVGQHLGENGVEYFGSGVGGYGNHDAVASNLTLWVDATYSGFMLHKVTKTSMVTQFIDKNGKVLHTATITHKPEDSGTQTSRRLRLR